LPEISKWFAGPEASEADGNGTTDLSSGRRAVRVGPAKPVGDDGHVVTRPARRGLQRHRLNDGGEIYQVPGARVLNLRNPQDQIEHDVLDVAGGQIAEVTHLEEQVVQGRPRDPEVVVGQRVGDVVRECVLQIAGRDQ